MDQVIAELARNGGFACLAACAIYVCYKQANLRAQDLSLASERERQARASLEKLLEGTLTQMANLCGEISGLKAAVDRLDDTRSSGPRRAPRGT